MRLTEFWTRMETALGAGYDHVWATQYVMSELGGRTAQEALDSGVSAKEVWLAVWSALGLPDRER